MSAALVAGREFNDTDRPSIAPVAIVNRRLASQFWPGENPVGKRLRLFTDRTPREWLTVVGVAPDIVQMLGEVQERIVGLAQGWLAFE